MFICIKTSARSRLVEDVSKQEAGGDAALISMASESTTVTDSQPPIIIPKEGRKFKIFTLFLI